MTSEISDKLLELTRFCSENQIGVEFLQYGATRNILEHTIIHGERVVQIEIGNPNDEKLFSELTEFLNNLKVLLSTPP